MIHYVQSIAGDKNQMFEQVYDTSLNFYPPHMTGPRVPFWDQTSSNIRLANNKLTKHIHS